MPSSARPASRNNDRAEDIIFDRGDGGIEETVATLGGAALGAAIVAKDAVRRATPRVRRRSSTPAATKVAATAKAATALPAITGAGKCGESVEPSGDAVGLGK